MNGLHRILILPPTSPNLIYTHSEKIHFEEFICYTASAISLWFGFSIFIIFNIISRLRNYFVKVCKQNNIFMNFLSINIKISSNKLPFHSSRE